MKKISIQLESRDESHLYTILSNSIAKSSLETLEFIEQKLLSLFTVDISFLKIDINNRKQELYHTFKEKYITR